MTASRMEDLYPASPAYLSLQPLRIPAGWVIGWNTLSTDLADPGAAPGGSSLFNATNPGRRFNIDVEYRPEFDPAGAFHLTVLYQPWPRTDRGRRLTSAPFALTGEAETVHGFETRAYPALVQALEHWIAGAVSGRGKGAERGLRAWVNRYIPDEPLDRAPHHLAGR